MSAAGAVSAVRTPSVTEHGPPPRAELDFGRLLAGVSERQPGATPEQVARRSAEEFVASTLIVPVLKALRAQNSAAPPFAPGEGERLFGPLLDEEIAVRISRAERFPLVDRLARDLLKQGGAPALERPTNHGTTDTHA